MTIRFTGGETKVRMLSSSPPAPFPQGLPRCADGPLPPAARRRADPLRPPPRTRPEHLHLRRRGNRHPDRPGGDPRHPPQRRRTVDRPGRDRRRLRPRPDRRRQPRRIDRALPADLRRAAGAGHLAAATRLPRHAQRQAARLLPQHLQGRRRPAAHPGRHPVRGHRRPPRLPLLGRARLQGRLRLHPRHRPRLVALSNTAGQGGNAPTTAARSCTSPTPFRCPLTWSPLSSASWRPPSR